MQHKRQVSKPKKSRLGWATRPKWIVATLGFALVVGGIWYWYRTISYEKVVGIDPDLARAAEVYQQACDRGSAQGCTQLGVLYEKGVGVDAAAARAAELYQRGCDAGNAEGCLSLGALYEEGRGIGKDEARAAELYEQACDKGSTDACNHLAAPGLGSALFVGSALPQYPWPPERPSSLIRLDKNLSLPRPGMSLLEVADLLSNALRDAAYFESSFYSAPGGFVIVTRLEAIDADGTPLRDERRYRLPDDDQDFSFGEYIRSLFFAPEGYYRFIVFVVTDVLYSTSDEVLPETETLERLRHGASGLPREAADLPFSQYHRIDALIYEFRKGSRDRDVEILRPGRLPPQTHLENSELAAALFGSAVP